MPERAHLQGSTQVLLSEGILGIDFGGTKVALSVEVGGTCVGEARIPIRPGEHAGEVIDRTIFAAKRLFVDTRETGVQPFAVGIATPGVVFEHGIELAPNVTGWSELSIRDRVSEGLGIQHVIVENDVKAAAIAEAASGALVGCDPGLYVNLGTGIAAAAIIGGVVLRGAHASAGEIGYGLVGAADELDWSGAGAPLEEYMGGRGLGERASERFNTDGSARSILERAHDDADVAAFVAEGVDELTRHLLTCVLLLDPQRVVIGGGMARATKVLVGPIRAHFDAALPHPPEVVLSRFGADASLRGALEIARRAFSQHLVMTTAP